MNQVFASASALILVLLLWGLGRKPRASLAPEVDHAFLAGLINPRITLLQSDNDLQHGKNQNASELPIAPWQPPKTLQDRINLRKELYHLITGCPEERIKAVVLSDLWGHSSVLPILRRGIKDSDSRVVIATARALEKHRGVPNSTSANQRSVAGKPPLNVALMR